MKHIGRFLAVALIGLALGGCATDGNNTFVDGVGTVWNVLTGQQSSVQLTEKQVYIARNAFDAVKQTATNYLTLCHNSPSNPVCSKGAEGEIVQAVRAGTAARNNITAFIKAHPDGVGGQSLYDQLVAATNAIKAVIAAYKIGG